MTSTTILDRNFTIKYNELITKYGNELAKLNGLSPDQLNLTGFIDNFTETNIVADASIDPSANVGRKDMVSMIHEMPKSQLKLLCYHKLYIEMTKEFGKAVADEWLEAEWTGWLNMHDAHTCTLVPYCFAFDLKRTAEEGLFWLKRHNAKPAKHLETFVDFLKEFINFTSNRQAGAVGLPNLIPYLFYFWKKDCESGHKPADQTPEQFARSEIQRLIYAVNQPYVRDGLQSAFTNSSIFDHEYMMALFGGATFPDGSFMVDYIDEMVEFQKLYMQEFSDIRAANMFTFPVNSISILKDEDGNPVDEEFAKWAIEHNMKWSDSNLFVDSSVTSLSNCCFDGSQKCLSKSPKRCKLYVFRRAIQFQLQRYKERLYHFHNGNWVKGKLNRLINERDVYRVITVNNKELLLTDNHINVTKDGEKPTDMLTTDDYLMFSTNSLNAVHEVDNNLTYEQGYLIGMYLGDGSMDNEDSSNTACVNLSLNEEKYTNSIAILQKAVGDSVKIVLGKQYHNVYPVRINNNDIYGFIRQFCFWQVCF